MKRVTETIARQWELLSVIPREPRVITTAEIRQRLARQGHDVSVRTIQRDLISLETKFMLTCRTEGRTNSWSWCRDRTPLEIPGISNVAAITLLMVRDYLLPVLPSVASAELQPYFEKASAQLKGTKFERWASCVRILQRGPVLAAPAIDPSVRDAVYSALIDGVQLELDYRSREAAASRRMTVNPLGLVLKDGVFYLVATLWGYDDPRQLALHRMSTAKRLEAKAKSSPQFALREYTEKREGFAYLASPRRIKLKAMFDAGAAHHLSERKLSTHQRLKPCGDGRVILEAEVADTAELRWWLLGFGPQIEIRHPPKLRDEFEAAALAMAHLYHRRKGTKPTRRRK